MGKTRRQRKITIYCRVEGDREDLILQHLIDLYSDPSKVSIPDNRNARGGNPDEIIAVTLRNAHFNKTFVWIDEDVDISPETREGLGRAWRLDGEGMDLIAKCPLNQIQTTFNQRLLNPIIIVSTPISVESLVLQMLGRNIPHSALNLASRDQQIRDLKNAVKSALGGQDEIEHYRQHLTKMHIDNIRVKIPLIDQIIKIIES